MIILLVVLVLSSLTGTVVSVIYSNGKSSASNSVMAGGSASPSVSFYILPYYFQSVIQFLTNQPASHSN